MEISALDDNVIARIRSGSTMDSITQCVNELVLNSLDAKASAIAVRVNIGTFRIQVVDNGRGISRKNLNLVGVRYMTSKCHSLSDLRKRLEFYGFRGEALANIAKVSGRVDVTSRAQDETDTYCKVLETQGITMIRTRNSCGTTVTIDGFLANLPVRQRCIKATEMEAIKKGLERILIIHPKVSFSLRNDGIGKIILESSKCVDVASAFQSIHPFIDKQLFFSFKVEKHKISVKSLLYKDFHETKNLQYIYVNKRAVNFPKLQSFFSNLFQKVKHSAKMNPIFVIHIKCPHSYVDFTLAPNKTTVLFKHLDLVKQCLEKIVVAFLGKENVVLPKKGKNKEPKPLEEFGLSHIEGAVCGLGYKRRSDDENRMDNFKLPRIDEFPIENTFQKEYESVHQTFPNSPNNEKSGKKVIMEMFMKSMQVEPGSPKRTSVLSEIQEKTQECNQFHLQLPSNADDTIFSFNKSKNLFDFDKMPVQQNVFAEKMLPSSDFTFYIDDKKCNMTSLEDAKCSPIPRVTLNRRHLPKLDIAQSPYFQKPKADIFLRKPIFNQFEFKPITQSDPNRAGDLNLTPTLTCYPKPNNTGLLLDHNMEITVQPRRKFRNCDGNISKFFIKENFNDSESLFGSQETNFLINYNKTLNISAEWSEEKSRTSSQKLMTVDMDQGFISCIDCPNEGDFHKESIPTQHKRDFNNLVHKYEDPVPSFRRFHSEENKENENRHFFGHGENMRANSDIEANSKNYEWIKQTNSFGTTIYKNNQTGIVSLHMPKEDINFKLVKRFEFIPKGVSPILKEIDTVESLSPESKKVLNDAVIKQYDDELLVVKWQKYIDNKDPKSFFDQMYIEKSKMIENTIPNINKTAFAKKAAKTFKSMHFTKELFESLIIVGQVDCKFIAVLEKTNNLLMMFDQHAVHERIRLERLIKDYKNQYNKIDPKITLFLRREDLQLIIKHKSELNTIGIFFQSFSDGITIENVPNSVFSKSRKGVNLIDMIEALIREVVTLLRDNNGVIVSSPLLIQNIVNSEACRGAIKFGDFLSNDECITHLMDLSRCQLPFQCAHGRPTLSPLLLLNQPLDLLPYSKPKYANLRL